MNILNEACPHSLVDINQVRSSWCICRKVIAEDTHTAQLVQYVSYKSRALNMELLAISDASVINPLPVPDQARERGPVTATYQVLLHKPATSVMKYYYWNFYLIF